MPSPQEQPCESANPELNPLLNPLLSGNLSRWAQVYFGNPPEKRDEAVTQLLRELQSQAPPSREIRPEIRQADAATICGKCGQQNPMGQKFCGACGTRLPEIRGAVPRFELVKPNAPAASLAAEEKSEDMEWLRDRLILATEEAPPAQRGWWRYGVLGLLLLLGAFGLLEWVSRTPPRAIDAITPNPNSTPPNSSAAPAGATNPAALPPAPEEVATPLNPASGTPLVLAGHHDAVPAENGARELSLAQQYLDGRHRPRDEAEAVRWLWKAVGKQNTTASVMLADFYLRGIGVTRNCDQARLLLAAASRKGSANAAAKLGELDNNGCR